MLVDLEVFYLGHLNNFYTIQYNTICLRPWFHIIYDNMYICMYVLLFHDQLLLRIQTVLPISTNKYNIEV